MYGVFLPFWEKLPCSQNSPVMSCPLAMFFRSLLLALLSWWDRELLLIPAQVIQDLRGDTGGAEPQKWHGSALLRLGLLSGCLTSVAGHSAAAGSSCHHFRLFSAFLSLFPSGGAAPNLPSAPNTQAFIAASPLLSPRSVPQCLIVLIVSQSLHLSSAIIQVFVSYCVAEGIKQCQDNEKSDTEGQMTLSL